MARPLRLEYADAAHYVMSRGIEGRKICRDDVDRDTWLDVLGRTAERFGWKVCAFSLLNDHYCLLLGTPEAGLAPGMRQLNGDYAGWFNRRHGRRGPLMQGRYKSVLVEGRLHGLELSRYMHLNPVRAGLCRRPEDWKWSSYRGYNRPALRQEWLDCRAVLSEYGRDEAKARRAYRQYMKEGLGRKIEDPVSRAAHGLVLGSDEFVKKVRKMLSGRGGDAEVPDLARFGRGADLGKMVDRAAKRLKADRSGWLPGRRDDDLGRAMCAYAVRQASGARNRELAAALGYRSPSSVTAAYRRVRDGARSASARRELAELVKYLAGRG